MGNKKNPGTPKWILIGTGVLSLVAALLLVISRIYEIQEARAKAVRAGAEAEQHQREARERASTSPPKPAAAPPASPTPTPGTPKLPPTPLPTAPMSPGESPRPPRATDDEKLQGKAIAPTLETAKAPSFETAKVAGIRVVDVSETKWKELYGAWTRTNEVFRPKSEESINRWKVIQLTEELGDFRAKVAIRQSVRGWGRLPGFASGPRTAIWLPVVRAMDTKGTTRWSQSTGTEHPLRARCRAGSASASEESDRRLAVLRYRVRRRQHPNPQGVRRKNYGPLLFGPRREHFRSGTFCLICQEPPYNVELKVLSIATKGQVSDNSEKKKETRNFSGLPGQ